MWSVTRQFLFLSPATKLIMPVVNECKCVCFCCANLCFSLSVPSPSSTAASGTERRSSPSPRKSRLKRSHQQIHCSSQIVVNHTSTQALQLAQQLSMVSLFVRFAIVYCVTTPPPYPRIPLPRHSLYLLFSVLSL